MDNNSINALVFIVALSITAWVIIFKLTDIMDYFSNWAYRKTVKPGTTESNKIYYDMTPGCKSSVSNDLKTFFLYVDKIRYSYLIKNVGLEATKEQVMTYYLLENGEVVNQYKHQTLNLSYSRFLLFRTQEDKERFIKAVFPPCPGNM